jgi:integrase
MARSPRRTRTHRSSYGTVRALPSGRFQARHTGPDGEMRTAPHTFDTHRAAEDWLAGQRTDTARGTWRAPERGAVPLADYAHRWLAARDLAPRTRALYTDLLDRWITAEQLLPGTRRAAAVRVDLGGCQVASITPGLVREWRAAVLVAARTSAQARTANAGNGSRAVHPARVWARQTGRDCPSTGRLPAAVLADWAAAGRPDTRPQPEVNPDAGRTQAAQAYRLLHSILADAVQENLVDANPCQIKNAGDATAAERQTATPDEIDAIAAAMPERYRAAVLVAAWSGLRAGELFALARRHVDLDTGTLRVERAIVEITGQPVGYGPPKSDAGRRTVHLPATVTEVLAEHLAAHVAAAPDALVFGTATGRPLRAGNRGQIFHRARAAAGRPDLRWHDLRHTGATLAAQTGATLKSLQRRMGHSTVRAALIYQHATEADDALIARKLDAQRTGTLRTLRSVPA